MGARVGRYSAPGEMRQGLEHRAALKEVRRAREAHKADGGGSSTYVPSEANTLLLAEALRLAVGPLLEERDQAIERWQH